MLKMTLRKRPFHLATSVFVLAALLCLTLWPAHRAYALSSGSDDRVSFGNDITVSAGETAQDIACAFCSVHIHGDVHGDVAVAFGSVTLDGDRTISGDLAVLGGDVNLGENSSVNGDAAIAAGDLTLAPTATVRGDRVVFPGRFWLLVPFAPFLILIGIVWLIVYLVRRNRYQFPAYPNGRRI